MNNTTIMLLLLGFGLFFNSCDDGLCSDNLCKNGGTCDDGICNCLGGYYGEFCEKEYLCYNSNCGKNAYCDTLTGNCICFPGYTSCDSTNVDCLCELREDILGDYTGYHECSPSSLIYSSEHSIIASWRSAEYFIINDFNGVNLPVRLINKTQFEIPRYQDALGNVFIGGDDNVLGNNSNDIGTYDPDSGILKFTYRFTYSFRGPDVCDVVLYPR